MRQALGSIPGGPFTSVLLRGRPLLLFAQRELARFFFMQLTYVMQR